MAEEYFPFDAGPGADSTETRWRRMARIWAPSGVVGVQGSNAYGLTVSGLNATLGRDATTAVAEAWVDGFMHRITTSDLTTAIPANASSLPRVDRLVLRLNATANTIAVTRLAGTPASPALPPALTQVNDGIWDVPLWRFTVPANSAAPLTNLVDERVWVDPSGGSAPRGVVGYGSLSSTQTASSTTTRVLGALNLVLPLFPGRLYSARLVAVGSPTLPTTSTTTSIVTQVLAVAGSTPPTTSTGTTVAGDQVQELASGSGNGPRLTLSVGTPGFFTVGTLGPYAVSPFLTGSGSLLPAPSGVMALIVSDEGSSASSLIASPIAVP